MDRNPLARPDVLYDLDNPALPFKDNSFDEIHAYDVLEHCGKQGDWRFFFGQFSEIWRTLKPGGFLFAICPAWDSVWAWGDPSHTRVINHGSLAFLDQTEYAKQLGKTAMSDFRDCYKADFERYYMKTADERFMFVLRARKPAAV